MWGGASLPDARNDARVLETAEGLRIRPVCQPDGGSYRDVIMPVAGAR